MDLHFSNMSQIFSVPHENDVEEKWIELYRRGNHHQCSSVPKPNFMSLSSTWRPSHQHPLIPLPASLYSDEAEVQIGHLVLWCVWQCICACARAHAHTLTHVHTQADKLTHTLTGPSAQSAMLLECKDARMKRKERGKESWTGDLLGTFLKRHFLKKYMQNNIKTIKKKRLEHSGLWKWCKVLIPQT